MIYKVFINAFILCDLVLSEKNTFAFLEEDARQPSFDLTQFQTHRTKNIDDDLVGSASEVRPGFAIALDSLSFVVQPDIKQILPEEAEDRLKDLLSDDIPLDEATSKSLELEHAPKNKKSDITTGVYASQLATGILNSQEASLQTEKRDAKADPYEIKQAPLQLRTHIFGTNYDRRRHRHRNLQQHQSYPYRPRSHLTSIPEKTKKTSRHRFSNYRPVPEQSFEDSYATDYAPTTRSNGHSRPYSKTIDESDEEGYSYVSPPASIYEQKKPQRKLVDILRVNDEVLLVNEPKSGKSTDSEFTQTNSIVPQEDFLQLDRSNEEISEKSSEEMNNDEEELPVITNDREGEKEVELTFEDESDLLSLSQELELPAVAAISQIIPESSDENDHLIYEGDLGFFGDVGRVNETLSPVEMIPFTIDDSMMSTSEEDSSEEGEDENVSETFDFDDDDDEEDNAEEVPELSFEIGSSDEIKKMGDFEDLITLAKSIFVPENESEQPLEDEEEKNWEGHSTAEGKQEIEDSLPQEQRVPEGRSIEPSSPDNIIVVEAPTIITTDEKGNMVLNRRESAVFSTTQMDDLKNGEGLSSLIEIPSDKSRCLDENCDTPQPQQQVQEENDAQGK